MEKRIPYVKAWKELSDEKAMIFLAGPRQTGKTTLAKMIAEHFVNRLYWNWDIPDHRRQLMQNSSFFTEVIRKDSSKPFIIFDEIHKYRDWKNYLKGVYDQYSQEYQFLVSGSGRLDLYQRGGDSLAGRYYLFHLFPFTMAEIASRHRSFSDFVKDPLQISMKDSGRKGELWKQLDELSGFPEPFLSGKKTTYRRWSTTYSRQLIMEDIRDLTEIKSVQDVETLYLLLPSKIGSPLSVTSLSETLKVSYNTVRSWLDVMERFYLAFSIPTWTGKIARAIQKEKKYYIWDYPRIESDAARFENRVACDLWRAVMLWTDLGLGRFSLHFIKDKEKREVDFLLAKDSQPFLLIEAKLSESQPSKTLMALQNKLHVPAVQLNDKTEGYRLIANESEKILIAPACCWLAGLP